MNRPNPPMKELPKCRVLRAFGSYGVGAVIQPTGLYRDHLVAAGLVQIIKTEDVSQAAAQQVKAEVQLPRSSRTAARRKFGEAKGVAT